MDICDIDARVRARRATIIAGTLAAVALAAIPTRAHAFTPRVHMILSNEIRAALIESGDGTIRLRWSEHAVRIPMEDADAIVDHPLAFRAGAIGPDNLIFPLMTDGSHAVDQDPYRQCQLLYEEAETSVERAFALGCFLHGATDAIAHHLVNYFSGETFTLEPISAGRESSPDNAVGHIVTESIIQAGIRRADPSLFTASRLSHTYPQDFVLRTYYDTESAVWRQLARHPRSRWEAVRAADPDGDVLSWASSAGFAPWEQIAMAPVYIEELQRALDELRAWIDAEIADMSDPTSERGSQLDLRPGADGVRGTPDDVRGPDGCSAASCASLIARYYVLVNVVAPRVDAAGRPLPSAFDALSSDLSHQLYGFLPALVQVIDGFSSTLNAPIPADDTGDHGIDVDRAEIGALFTPLTSWADGLVRTTTTGFDDLGRSITPDWYEDLSLFLASLGVDVTIGNVLRLVFGPVMDEIRETLITQVQDRAVEHVEGLEAEYDARLDGWRARVTERLDASAPAGLSGHAIDHPLDSGMFAYAINFTAATLANHEIVLVADEPIAHGPTSFDTSYTVEWSQVGLCGYLRGAVFPQGTTVAALLSVNGEDRFYGSPLAEDSPVECHDGALDAFGSPSVETCGHTTLEALRSDPVGSVSRGFPPEFASGEPGCRNLVVPGLPEPPPTPDAGVPATTDAATLLDGGAAMVDAGTGEGDGGCSCAAPGARRAHGGHGSEGGQGGEGGGLPWTLLPLLALLAWARRGRRRLHAGLGGAARVGGLLAISLLALGCDGTSVAMDAGADGGGAMDSSTPDDDADVTVPDPDAGADAGEPDAGPDLRAELPGALSESVWSGSQTRTEGSRSVTRAYELRFDTDVLQWAEIRNPFGPGRRRVLRNFRVDPDGRTVESTVTIPTGWETPEALRGRHETWELEILEGFPRFLQITNVETGEMEVYAEGAWPAPTGGLTAEVRVFGSSGDVFDAFCGASSTSWERGPVWDFARGTSGVPLRTDVVAGAHLGEWRDGVGTFSVSDIDGFDRLGGTELSDQASFVVRYTGSVSHPGHLSIRERDDDYAFMGAWVFTGSHVGTGRLGTELFEIHGFLQDDDEVVTAPGLLEPGELEVELIVVWCAGAGSEPFALEASTTSADGPFGLFGELVSTPVVDDAFFPPAL